MRHNIQNLVVRLPFSEALAGEFAPQCDPESRLHNLNRLAFAAYAKGEPLSTRLVGKGLGYSRLYYPSWAPEVAVTALTTAHGPIHRLVGLALKSPEGAELTVNDTSSHLGFSLTIENGVDESQRITLLDERMAYARRIVTEAADAFFNPKPDNI